jgi:DNA (cytosine-5)-methyltransferase 1
MRIGSLCTGIAGLELGLQYAGIETKPVFVSDIDPGACDWLAQAMPYTPNLGDFTELDELPEADIITAGFPCQPVSTAGLRKGINDERWLFDDICRLVSQMDSRPVLFLENVSGILTANSGDAMARVVHSLADIGYHITWGTLPAAAVGAPHRRNRWWGLAYSADTDGVAAGRNSGAAFGSEKQARRESHGSDRFADGVRAITADTDGPSSQTRIHPRLGSQRPRPQPVGHSPHNYGPFLDAVQRWERILGRLAPSPVDEKQRLNPAFVEWMMGYPEGWVTDVLPRRTQSLHALGNAVVPQCAAAAFTQLCTR